MEIGPLGCTAGEKRHFSDSPRQALTSLAHSGLIRGWAPWGRKGLSGILQGIITTL